MTFNVALWKNSVKRLINHSLAKMCDLWRKVALVNNNASSLCTHVDGESHLKGHSLTDTAHATQTCKPYHSLLHPPGITVLEHWCVGFHCGRAAVLTPFIAEPITFSPSAHAQLHSEAPVRNLRNNPQPFNDRKRSRSLSSTLLSYFVWVHVCMCAHRHISTTRAQLVIIREAGDDIFTPRHAGHETGKLLNFTVKVRNQYKKENLYGGAWNLILLDTRSDVLQFRR